MWKLIFNRFLDAADLSSDNQEKLKVIEQEIFLNIKPQVERELDQTWDGDQNANRLADQKVAMSFKKSFINYESDRSKDDPKYFKF